MTNDRHWGVEVDYGKKLLIWSPRDLEANIFSILGTLRRDLRLRFKGEVTETNDGRFQQEFDFR